MNYFGTFISLLAFSLSSNTVVEAQLSPLRLSQWQNRPQNPTLTNASAIVTNSLTPAPTSILKSFDTQLGVIQAWNPREIQRLLLRTNRTTSAHLWLQNKAQFKQATIDSIQYDRYTPDHLWLQKAQLRPSASSPPASEGEKTPITSEPRVSQDQLHRQRNYEGATPPQHSANTSAIFQATFRQYPSFPDPDSEGNSLPTPAVASNTGNRHSSDTITSSANTGQPPIKHVHRHLGQHR
jgi:hypothetical protein